MNFKKIFSHATNKGNTLIGFLAIAGMAAFLVLAVGSVGQDVFLGAQIGGRGGASSVPDAPLIRSVEQVSDTEVLVTWLEPASSGGDVVNDYIVSIYVDAKILDVISIKSIDTSFLATELPTDVEIGFTIQAVNRFGIGPESAIEVITLLGKGGGDGKDPGALLSAPVALEATPLDSAVDLTWIAPRDASRDLLGYVVAFTAAGGREVTIETKSTDTQFMLENLTNDTRYSIRVAGINDAGVGEFSTPVEVIPSAKIVATAPDTPTGITVTPGDSTITISWVAPNNGGSPITSYILSYTFDNKSQTIELPPTPTTYTLTGLRNGTTYVLGVIARNNIGDSESSIPVKSAPDKNIEPSILGRPQVVVSDTSAIITWSTNKNTSTRVDFGLLSTKTSTPEVNRETRVTNHSVTIYDLLPCTTYSYVVKSYDALSQVATGGEERFTTSGCISRAQIQAVKQAAVDTSVGGLVDFTDTNTIGARLAVPQNLKVGQTEVLFQVKLLEKTTVKEDIGLPTDRVTWLGDHVYNLAAYSTETEEKLNDFDEPLTVTIEYTRDDVRGFDLSTLTIFHYDDRFGWRNLQECSNTYDPTTAQGEISCKTESFSIFGLFAESASGPSTGVIIDPNLPTENGNNGTDAPSDSSTPSPSPNQGGGRTTQTTRASMVVLTDDMKNASQAASTSDEGENAPKTIRQFTQDLWFGMTHLEVLDLQRFLNQQGFILAETGPGSPGNETGYFGPRTFRALRQFQIFYKDAIVAPSSFQKASGYLDYFTRQFIQENF